MPGMHMGHGTGAMGDGMAAMTLEQFQNMNTTAQTTILFRMTQGMMPMMAMMQQMMPGMMDMRVRTRAGRLLVEVLLLFFLDPVRAWLATNAACVRCVAHFLRTAGSCSVMQQCACN